MVTLETDMSLLICLALSLGSVDNVYAWRSFSVFLVQKAKGNVQHAAKCFL